MRMGGLTVAGLDGKAWADVRKQLLVGVGIACLGCLVALLAG